jgi:predicted protein tyrosine phosphatase
MLNVLFVCTLNKARSITAERMYRRTPGIRVRSAGISERAAHQVVEADLEWADRVIVFAPEHERWIRDTFTGALPEIIDVGVADDHAVDAPGLIAELAIVLPPALGCAPRGR